MLKPIALSQPETVVVTVWIPCVYHRWWRQRYKFHFVFHANIVTRAERLSVCLSVCLSLCRRWRGTVFKAVANTLLCSVHYCFRLTVLSFSMYGLLMMVCTEEIKFKKIIKNPRTTRIGRRHWYSVGMRPSIPVSLKHFRLSPDAFLRLDWWSKKPNIEPKSKEPTLHAVR